MNFTREQVLEQCKLTAPKYDFDWKLVFAVCLQEGERDNNGVFDPSIARLEQNFYRKYSAPLNFATTSEVLLAASYGCMQMMGESLRQVNYFVDFYNKQDDNMKKFFGFPMSPFAVCAATDEYCVNLSSQIEYGVRWLGKKRLLANGDEFKTLCYWNGDTTGKYANEVLSRKAKL